MIIRAFRIRGHLAADLDPLEINSQNYHPELDPANYGFSPNDMEREIYIDNVLGLEAASMSEILNSRRIRVFMNRVWQWSVLRKLLFGPITGKFPASLLQNHKEVSFHVVKSVIEIPELGLK